jgi:hypothetical protein
MEIAERRTHNPLVAGSSPAGPTKRSRRSEVVFLIVASGPKSRFFGNYQQNASHLFEGRHSALFQASRHYRPKVSQSAWRIELLVLLDRD